MTTPINTGLSAEDRKRLAEELSRTLADSYTLYMKTHKYHWNVEGPHFKALHDLFEAQYTDLATAVDDIAERIRALGHYAPGSYKAFSELSEVQDDTGHADWQTMVRRLAEDQETVVNTCRRAVATAGDLKDASTQDLLNKRMRTHEKNAWMLRAHLEG